MEVTVAPSNIRTVKMIVRRRGTYVHASLTFPRDIIDRYDIKDGENVVICYLSKADEDYEVNENNKKS